MKTIIGIVVGVVWIGIAVMALRHGSGNWAAGNDDLGFWWTVIGTLLLVAGCAAVIGTVIHSRQVRQ
jgi:hypothetical protein